MEWQYPICACSAILLVVILLVSFSPQRSEYYDDCYQLLTYHDIRLNDCIKFMEKNPRATGNEAISAIKGEEFLSNQFGR